MRKFPQTWSGDDKEKWQTGALKKVAHAAVIKFRVHYDEQGNLDPLHRYLQQRAEQEAIVKLKNTWDPGSADDNYKVLNTWLEANKDPRPPAPEVGSKRKQIEAPFVTRM